MERHFRILGVPLTLAGPADELEPIAFAYRRFETEAAGNDDADRLSVRLADPRTLVINDRAESLVPGLAPGIYLYQRLQAALMDAVGGWAVLHAAALIDDRGEAFVLAGPSGHGKSSLTLELAQRGHAFLSDDIAPLDLAESLVSPFPRAVAVVPEACSPVPEPFHSASRKPSAVRWFDKALIDVGEILGEEALVDRPVPLRHVLLLVSGDAGHPSTTVVELAVRAECAAELDELFDRTDGAEVLERRATDCLGVWKLRLDHERRPTGSLSEVFDSDRIVWFDKRWDDRPDFDTTPEASPVTRREAAEMLGREMLNRRSGGRLLARYEGSVARLFVDLAGALRDAACWTVRVGGHRETADLVQQRIGATGR